MRLPAALLNPSQARSQGLPNYTGGRRPLGGTASSGGAGWPSMAVRGSNTIKVEKDPNGGVQTVLERRIPHMELLNVSDFARLRALGGMTKSEAVRLSQGGLTSDELRKRNHPYGHGLKVAKVPLRGVRRGGLGRLRGSGRGVSNMAVVNNHSGEFAGAWTNSQKRDNTGVKMYLRNRKRYSRYLAFGTKRMRAHGPFSTAVVKHLPQIDAEVMRLARLAIARHNARQQLMMVGGLR